MTVLDLRPEWIVVPGERVVTRRVESQRAREAASRKRIADIRRARAVFA
jgi:hypothetical protein